MPQPQSAPLRLAPAGPVGRKLEKGPLQPYGRNSPPNIPSEITSGEPPDSLPETGKRALATKSVPNRPSDATPGEPAGRRPKARRRSLGSVWAKRCSKHAFRGHFCRAAGQLAGHWKKEPWGHLGENVLQTCLQRPLLASRRPAGRNLEKGPWGHLGENVLQTGLQRPLLPNRRASWPEPGKRGLGAIWAKRCSKQAFRGHFCRAAGQLAGTWKKGPWAI